jgi:hypothetical protein
VEGSWDDVICELVSLISPRTFVTPHDASAKTRVNTIVIDKSFFIKAPHLNYYHYYTLKCGIFQGVLQTLI